MIPIIQLVKEHVGLVRKLRRFSAVDIVLTIPEGFLPTFSTPKNLAESDIVAALLKGAVQLAGGQLGNQKSGALGIVICLRDVAITTYSHGGFGVNFL